MKILAKEEVANALKKINAARTTSIGRGKERAPKVVSVKFGKQKVGMYLAANLILLNSRYFKGDDLLRDPEWLSILAHEMTHMRQGSIVAFSVFGELEAWQEGWKVLANNGHPLTPAQLEILTLPVKMERNALKHAQKLMYAYAGKAYGIQNRTLYPLHLELLFWLGLRC